MKSILFAIKIVFLYMKSFLKKVERKIIWRKRNFHNETSVNGSIAFEHIEVGNNSYGILNVLSYNDKFRLKIGHFCSIAGGVAFILSADHRLDTISTFPFKVKILHTAEYEAISKGDIIVDDDVWIGQNATILSGVHIGQGAVIAAGAIVAKDVPPYAVVGGNPAKIIKYRFSNELIEELVKVDYSKLTKEMIREHIEDLYQKLERPEQLNWMPKK